MGVLSKLIQFLVISAGLAFHEVFLKDWYKRWLEGQGKTYGFGESLILYFAVMVVSFTVGWLITRRIGRGEDA
ncbi:MAG: hypothetical protein FGF50_08655 [Candidatus Brockarchaeota archaeon]|nr:hypothetical protein [Candidatus Brockarchaeota archaeon]